jgi:hypothetical protein
MPQYVIWWDLLNLIASLTASLFAGGIYLYIFFRVGRGTGFGILAIANLALLVPTAIVLIGILAYRFEIVIFERSTLRILEHVRMIVLSMALIAGLVAPPLIAKYLFTIKSKGRRSEEAPNKSAQVIP